MLADASTLEALRQSVAQDKLLRFVQYTRPFYKANAHHVELCSVLDRFARGDIKRLMVFAPPRHGKSELVSRCLPAFLLGRDPDCRIIASSYAADLARQMGRAVQRLMDEPAYKGLFPASALEGSNIRTVADGRYLRNADEFEIVGRRGFYKCAGVGGGITGRGFDFGIIDDPVKDASEAWSETVRNAVWEWYTQVFLTRQEGNASILLTMTRWHVDDLAGRILAQGEPWHIVRMPALDVNGKALWEDKFSAAWLQKQKRALGSRSFEALYQQEPVPTAGNVWKVNLIRFYDRRPEQFDAMCQSWDMNFKETEGGSFVVGQVWGRRGADCFLLDEVRGRWGFAETKQTMINLSARWPQVLAKLVEDKANGPAIMDELRHTLPGLIAVDTGRDSKVARAESQAPLIEGGNVYLPKPGTTSIDTEDWLVEAAHFPQEPNDRVDAATHALKHLTGSGHGMFDAAQFAAAFLSD